MPSARCQGGCWYPHSWHQPWHSWHQALGTSGVRASRTQRDAASLRPSVHANTGRDACCQEYLPSPWVRGCRHRAARAGRRRQRGRLLGRARRVAAATSLRRFGTARGLLARRVRVERRAGLLARAHSKLRQHRGAVAGMDDGTGGGWRRAAQGHRWQGFGQSLPDAGRIGRARPDD